MKVTEFHYPPGIDLTMIQTDKFKSAALSASFLVPLKKETAAANALVPYVLRRGTERYPTMGEISVRLEEPYGGTLDPAVRKRGETQCVGLIGSFLDDAYALESGSNLQEAAALLEDLSRARQVAEYGASTGGGPVRLSVPQAGPAVGGGLELEALDRAVQRDARRYDGGFTLY